MQTTLPMESSLLLVIHEAEAAVRRYRVLHDLAAQVGVPAHITVAYPFKPTGAMGESDLARLGQLIAATPAFNIELASTGWFGTDVLFLTPTEPDPIIRLTHSVEAAFPDYPIYGGAYSEIHPHLTVAHGSAEDVLRDIEGELLPSLPITHRATSVQLWSGPALSTKRDGWHLVETFPLAN